MADDAPLFAAQNTAFLAWLTDAQHATVSPKIAIEDLRAAGAGRGIIAAEPLDADEVLFRLPRTATLTVESSQLSTLIPQELAELDAWLALVLVLIYETRADSPWKPYIDLLPATAQFNALMFWADEELAELAGSAVVGKIGRADAETAFRTQLWPVVQRHAALFGDTAIAPALAGDAMLPEDELLAAAHRMASVIMSYSFDLKLADVDSDDEDDDVEHVKAMVPLADLFNADAARNNCRLVQTPGVLEMRTLAAVGAGEELFNDYGPLPRADLLRRYGYITANYAEYDVVEIGAPLLIEVAAPGMDEKEKGRRVDYLLEEDVMDDAFDIPASAEVPEEVLIAVHTLLLSDADFQTHRKAGKLPRPRKTEAVARVLREVCEKRLAQYPTGIEEDEQMLKQKGLSWRKRAAVEVRLGEKRILAAVRDGVGEWEGERNKRPREGETTGGGSKKVKAR